MAFVDSTINARIIKEGFQPVKVTLAEACTTGDPLGYSSGWKLADADNSIYAELVAGQVGAIGDEIVAYRKAVIDLGSGCTATAGDKVYLSATAGGYAATSASGAKVQVVGIMTTAQIMFVEPQAVILPMLSSQTISHIGTAAKNGVDLTINDSTTMASGYAHGIHLNYNKSGATSGGSSVTQFNAFGVDYTISGGGSSGYNAFYAYMAISGSPTLSAAAIGGVLVELTEMGATDYFFGLGVYKYNTTLGALDAFILLYNQATGVTRDAIRITNVNTTNLFNFTANTGGFLDAGVGVTGACNGHILVRCAGNNKYLRLYDSAA